MFKILKIETKQYLKDPLIYGFFVLPIILIAVFSLALSKPMSLSSVIFIQTMLVTLFIYGNKIMIYKNDTLRKKVNNSKLKNINITLSLIIINFVFILLSLVIPLFWMSIDVHSVKWAEENQWWYFNTNGYNHSQLQNGLLEEFLLFNASFLMFIQFMYAYLITNLVCFSFAHIMAKFSKDDVRYFSISIIFSILILLTSNIFTKDNYVMTDGAYVQDSMIIKNGLWKVIRNVNPFYWTNQMLANTIVADVFSGSWQAGEMNYVNVSPDGITNIIPLEGWWTPAYYNIFHIGTNANPEINTQRPIVLSGIEVYQIALLFIPLLFGTSFIISSFIIGEVNR